MNLGSWDIDTSSLREQEPNESQISYQSDSIYPSPDDLHAAVLYEIEEIRMGWYVGNFAIFKNRDQPQLLLAPTNFRCCFEDHGVRWLSNELLAAKKFYYDSAAHRINVPFVLIDLARRRYSFLPIINSYPYLLSLQDGNIRLMEMKRDERFPSQDGEEHVLASLPWFDLDDLNQFDRRYEDYALR